MHSRHSSFANVIFGYKEMIIYNKTKTYSIEKYITAIIKIYVQTSITKLSKAYQSLILKNNRQLKWY